MVCYWGSLFASNIGSEHIVGLAGLSHEWYGDGALGDACVDYADAGLDFRSILLSNVFTLPEFLEKRFDSRVRWILSLVSLVAYVFTKVSVTVYAGALVFVRYCRI